MENTDLIGIDEILLLLKRIAEALERISMMLDS